MVFKGVTGADGVRGKAKVERLPEGRWNRYGGTLEYRAHKALFPEGLDTISKSIGLPLITHGRWIDRRVRIIRTKDFRRGSSRGDMVERHWPII